MARKLGRTVSELRASLTQQEFIEQFIYDQRKAQREEMERLKAKRGR